MELTGTHQTPRAIRGNRERAVTSAQQQRTAQCHERYQDTRAAQAVGTPKSWREAPLNALRVSTLLLAALVLAVQLAPAQTGSLQELTPATRPGAMAPNLTETSGGVVLTWLEPSRSKGAATTLYFARLQGDRWSAPHAIVSRANLIDNWADVPGLTEAADGTLFAHWLEQIDDSAFAYGAKVARSNDRGATWQELGWLQDDTSLAEHGFVSYALTEGGVQAFWLDGRKMPTGGAMALRTTLLKPSAEQPPASQQIAPRVCECCQTDAASTSDGAIVVYRNRARGELRDTWIVRQAPSGWSEPKPVFEDGWMIEGCPVNGPAVAARGKSVVVAWFTAKDEHPRVLAAFSSDAGASFGAPLTLAEGQTLGRLDAAFDGSRAWVSWLQREGDDAILMLRDLSAAHATERLAAPLELARTTPSRQSGFPRLAVDRSSTPHRLVLAWVEVGDGTTVHTAALPLATRAASK